MQGHAERFYTHTPSPQEGITLATEQPQHMPFEGCCKGLRHQRRMEAHCDTLISCDSALIDDVTLGTCLDEPHLKQL